MASIVTHLALADEYLRLYRELKDDPRVVKQVEELYTNFDSLIEDYRRG